MTKNIDSGLVFFCDHSGKIQTIEKNSTGIPDVSLIGRMLIELVPSNERGAVLSLLSETHTNKVCFSKPLHFVHDAEKVSFFLSSVRFKDNFLVLASRNKADFEGFLSQMMSINNEQTNELRRRIKLQSDEKAREKSLPGAIDFEEFTRLNNELVNMQRELAKKNRMLTLLNEEKNRFLGMAAHDLRNPLSVIMSYSEIILEESPELTEDGRSFLETILHLSGFMLEMVEDLLDVTVIESGKIELKKEDVEVCSFISRTIELQKVVSQRKGISIIMPMCEESLWINIDTRRMEQVLANLLVNAVKFSHSNSQVTVSYHRSGDDIIIKVSDQGVGIPKDELENLFKPFARTSSRPTGGEKSTGLGLVIAKKIVEAHNGTIRCESEYGVGSDFIITLPEAKPL